MLAEALGAYAGIAIAPHLDRLAAQGVVYERAYCNYPLCAPSRFSMASGQLASRIGAFDNACEFPASIPTYAHYVRALGYQTCLSGKMHFVGPDQLHGFEKRLTPDIYPGDFTWTADWSLDGFPGATDSRAVAVTGICARSVQLDYDDDVTHKAVQEIYDIARSEDDRPFFLQASYTHPHEPYLCLRQHWDLYEGVDIPAPSVPMLPDGENDAHSIRILKQHGLHGGEVPEADIMRARRAYYGMVSYIDDQVGTLLAALEASGLADNTVIVITSDHGEMLGERGLWFKKTFFEPALRVPLILHAPGRMEPGRVATLASLVDLLPTFASIASDGRWDGAVEPLDGADLTVLGADGDRAVHAELLCEGIKAPIFMIRRGRFKFITGGEDPDLLFDVESDPDERRNLAGDPAHAQTVAAFAAEAATLWDQEALSQQIVLSQRRRLLVRAAHDRGARPAWDFQAPDTTEDRWFRGDGNYNDWAFDFLPESR